MPRTPYQLNPARLIRAYAGFDLVERQRNWIRDGYADGLYAVNAARRAPHPLAK